MKYVNHIGSVDMNSMPKTDLYYLAHVAGTCKTHIICRLNVNYDQWSKLVQDFFQKYVLLEQVYVNRMTIFRLRTLKTVMGFREFLADPRDLENETKSREKNERILILISESSFFLYIFTLCQFLAFDS